MPRTASDRARGGLAEHAPRPKCRSGRAAGFGLSPCDPIPTATGSAAPSPNNSLTSSSSCLASPRRLLASRHKSTAFARPPAARITLPALGIGFGVAGSEDMEGDAGAAAAGARAARAACRWEASPDGVIVLPVGSAAPRPRGQQREREAEREREQESNPGAAGVFAGEPPEKVFYKTRLCEKFEAGKCSYEDGCTFAHGQAELRPPMPVPHALLFKRRTPPPPPPPSSQPPPAAEAPFGGYYGAKVCFEFRDKGTCHYGDRCAYAHASAAEVAEMRYPGGPRSVEHALRNAPPYARAAFAPGGAARSCCSTISYAPAAAAATRAFPSAPPAPVGEDGLKLSRLELLGRKKMSGIYGDWPEEK
ncbi:unnamed protein product [Urochloa humidicola]